ncbi:MAG: helix-turn-helix domain-containing protein [Firmicutes bacterium]|nr:helix-turn-helix domain-containing protein [Bacillota bacterium]
MPKKSQLNLSAQQRQQLERVRDSHPQPYVRERAAAILKIADGQSARQVAKQGLLRARDKDTVCRWVRRYQTEGLEGLKVRPGRGRKPAFSPSARHTRSRCRATAGDSASFAPAVWS